MVENVVRTLTVASVVVGNVFFPLVLIMATLCE